MANEDEIAKIKARLNDIDLTVSNILKDYLDKMEIEGEPYHVSDMIKGKIEVLDEEISAVDQSQPSINQFGEMVRGKNMETDLQTNANIPHFEPPKQQPQSAVNEYEENSLGDNGARQGAVSGSKIVSGSSLEDEIRAYKLAHPEEFALEQEIVIEKFDDELAEQEKSSSLETMVDKTDEPDVTLGSYMKEGIKEDIENLKENMQNLTK